MSSSAARVLIVEDDAAIRGLVAELLKREAFIVDTAENAAAMDAAMANARPDVVILDLMLPGEDGLSICRRLRAATGVPILMLTAKSDEIDRVVGLELGADDYVVKPFGPRELLARVRSVLRRAQAPAAPAASRRLRFEGFIVDLDTRVLTTAKGEPVALTSAEFDLLACFTSRPRRVLTRDQIMDFTRGREAEAFDRSVDMLVSRLRRKLEAAGAPPTSITTVRNGGYLFTHAVLTSG